MITLLTGEAFQVINIILGPHDHLESRNDFIASGTISCVPEQPQVVSFAQHQIPFGVQSRPHFAQSTVAAAALQAILVPKLVQSSQQIAILDVFAAASAKL